MSKVAIVRCSSYEYGEVKNAVCKGIDLIGGVSAFAKKGEKILLKPNLLIGASPENCVTTHPSVFKAVAEIVKTTGAVVSFGDSPSIGSTRAAAKKSGLVDAAQEAGAELKEFGDGEEVHFTEGKQNKKFFIAKAVLESDGIISLPKLKTHGFQKYTGCIKNQFGCIPGLRKAEFHVRAPSALDFAKMLVDLDGLVRPRLYVMDGVIAMEGNGPRGGEPRNMNVLLFSADPVALDATACRLIGLDPMLVPTIRFGQEFGRGTANAGDIELLGDGIGPLTNAGFAVDRKPLRPFKEKGMMKLLVNMLVPRPVIDKNKCVRCGNCVTVCPVTPKAVNWAAGDKTRPPVHDYRICIRCYCCQEVCPEKAIELKKPLLRRLFSSPV